MVAPLITVVPHTKHTIVKNKNIVYSDTVLPFKDLGKNIKVSSISNVSEYSLEKCLQIVLESNPDVIFNTVQYSKENKKIYFYTDKEITTKAYEDSTFVKYKPITSNTLILEEIKNVLLTKKNNSNDCISLYSVGLLLKQLYNDYAMISKKYKQQFENLLKSTFRDSSIIIYDFNYKEKLLEIGFKRRDSEDFKDICFAKENNDLYIAKSKSPYDKEIFYILSSSLSKLYDEFMSYKDYKDCNKAKYDRKLVNSNFGVDISYHGIEIFSKFQKDSFFKLFLPSYTDKYSLECNSNIINESIRNKENEIFKRIFVRIENCPEWCQSILYKIRQKELEEDQRLEEESLIRKQKMEEEIKKKEAKKQKRLTLKQRFFHF